ncbi:MAG: DsbC family protein [Enterobacterales bacterium]|nr:DsbC family protein [Enterobacterales bacterium]
MFRFASIIFAVSLILFGVVYVFDVELFESKKANVGPSTVLTEEQVKQKLTKKLDGIQITDVSLSPIEGFYQVFYGSQILYVSYNGDYIFTGNLLNLSGPKMVNLTDDAINMKAAQLAPQRAATIAALKETDMVVFKAENEKHKITVFTDVDCTYCRKLHKEMPKLNELGITVRYLAFPRAGIGSSSYHKLVSVWCADDRQLAMNNAKLKRQFTAKTCENPIAAQYGLTREFGLSGTPAIILEDGELLAGYLPADRLAEHLKNKAPVASTGN